MCPGGRDERTSICIWTRARGPHATNGRTGASSGNGKEPGAKSPFTIHAGAIQRRPERIMSTGAPSPPLLERCEGADELVTLLAAVRDEPFAFAASTFLSFASDSLLRWAEEVGCRLTWPRCCAVGSWHSDADTLGSATILA